MVDVNAQQLDLRTVNSWMLKLDQARVAEGVGGHVFALSPVGATHALLLSLPQVEAPELAEVFVINAIAPFVLNSKLKPLMLRGRTVPTGSPVSGCA